jgi:hypothetical protein
MQSFVYKGCILKYERKNGQIIVCEGCYCGEQINDERVFASLGALRTFLDSEGWKTDKEEVLV